MSSSTDSSKATESCAPRQTNAEKFTLTEYFWLLTIAALSNSLPTPKLDFYFDGFRVFCLQAQEEEEDLLLLDYEDLAEADADSKRGFEFDVEDEESLATSGKVFIKEFEGRRESIDDAIELVCKHFHRFEQWYETVHSVKYNAETCDRESRLTVTISRPVIHYDCEEYQIDRRYREVLKDRGRTMHCLSRQSDECVRMEKVGYAVLCWVRVLYHTIKKRNCKEQKKKRKSIKK